MTNRNDKEARQDNVDLRKDFIDQWVHANPEATRADASALYDLLEKDFPEVSRGGHRGMVGRQKPWEKVAHECPCCGFTSVGAKDIASEFGFRNVNGKKYHQSWCPTCKNLPTPERTKRLEERERAKYVRVNPNTTRRYWTNGSEAGGSSSRDAAARK